MMRIVEVEPVPCQHLHSSNYDPAAVVPGQPIQILGDGRMWCFDCQEFFTYPARPPLLTPKYTLKEIEVLAREFIDERGFDEAEEYKLLISLFIQWLAKREREGLSNVVGGG